MSQRNEVEKKSVIYDSVKTWRNGSFSNEQSLEGSENPKLRDKNI